MNDADFQRWGVKRRDALETMNANISTNLYKSNCVLYYPGSGNDIQHALFAAYGRSTTFIFVDPQADLAEYMPTAIREESRPLDQNEKSSNLLDLKIASPADGAWAFNFNQVERRLFWFKSGHDEFLQRNSSFMCDVFFEKDFWETEAVVDIETVRLRLRQDGFYSTNASIGVLTSLLKLVGFELKATVDLNGTQWLFRFRKTGISWTTLWEQVLAAKAEALELIFEDEGPFDPLETKEFKDDEKKQVMSQAVNAIRSKLTTFNIPSDDLNAAIRQILEWALGAAASMYARYIAI